MAASSEAYYVPHSTHWSIVGSVGLALLLGGFAAALNGSGVGEGLMLVGAVVMAYMLFGWFGIVVAESESGTYSGQVDMSFRMGMAWFIFSEVMFFAAFFGALAYVRNFSVPWLGGEGAGGMASGVLWPGYQANWPTNGPGDMGGEFETIPAFGLPAVNTLILLSSGVTVTLAHWALKKDNRGALIRWLAATVALGLLFLGLQATEFHEAYTQLNLTLGSGVYGSTFFMLTGFHGLHVTIGAIMLMVILVRCIRGHFRPDNHFAFEAVSWYWHFVDVVWLGLFIFVYWF